MLKEIEPPKILCVGKPYKEMAGDIIHINYRRNSKIISQETIIENQDLIKDNYLFLPFE